MSQKLFAFVSDGDAFHFMQVPDLPDLAKLIAGLQSNPILVDISDNPEIMENPILWTYVDGKFIKTGIDIPQFDEDDYEVE